MRDVTSLREGVARFFSGTLNLDVPSADADLFETGILDSLAFVELLLHLEKEFGVTVEAGDLEVENFRSIAHIAEFVTAHVAKVA
jgi:acyl carrier protein